MTSLLLSLLVLLVGYVPAFAMESGESEKIEYLISSVGDLRGATFIRNGSEHDPKKAAEHLRYKLKKAGKRVKTAEDFITLIASRSSLSGKPYLIKFPDGTTVETESFFRDKLMEFSGKK